MAASGSARQLRCCHCSVHSHATAGVSPAEAAPPYIAPTRALLLHLSGFPPALLHPFAEDSGAAATPHLHGLLARATSMRLKWQEAAGFTSGSAASTVGESSNAAAAAAPSTVAADRALSTSLRLVGLHPDERAAASIRAQLLIERRRASGVEASPAAAYPPPFGRARVELASNHLWLHETFRREWETASSSSKRSTTGGQQTNGRAPNEQPCGHLNAPVFLDPQSALSPSGRSSPFSSSFRSDAHPALQSHSSVPLRTDQQRAAYIRCIVRHAAERLGLRCREKEESSTSAADSTSDPPPAHILLLHLDAQALLGTPASPEEQQQHSMTALQFVEQLLSALLTQIELRAADPWPRPAGSPSALASSLTAADNLFSSATSAQPSICPRVMWAILVDNQEEQAGQAKAVDADVQQQRHLLAFLRPVQSFQVQDGVVDRRAHGWSSCMAYVWHADSTRAPCPAEGKGAPVQGALHIAHFLKEIVFKLGLGSKYGA